MNDDDINAFANELSELTPENFNRMATMIYSLAVSENADNHERSFVLQVKER